MSFPGKPTINPWHVFRSQYGFGDQVTLRLGDPLCFGQVTAICFRPDGHTYRVSWGDGTSTWHFAFQLRAAGENEDVDGDGDSDGAA